MKKSLLAVALMGLVSGLFADTCNSHGCIDKIEKLYLEAASGRILVGTPGDETLANCSPVSNVYFTLEQTQPGYNTIYSTLLAAKIANKTVQLRIAEESSNCRIQYITITD